MKRVLNTTTMLLAVMLSYPAASLSGQIFSGLGTAVPGEDAVSVGLVFGQMSPQTTFRDGSRFESSTLIGATANFWPHRYLGVQLSSLGTEHVGSLASDGSVSIITQRDPKIWTTIGDAVLRYPLGGDGPISFFPYAALGGGWKTYRWMFDPKAGPDARGFDMAWSYAAGADLRFGAERRFGLRGEFRNIQTPFERFGESLTHKDRVLTGTLLLNF